ncbi:hypothetical protein F6Y02_08490 [Bacillus megaterium]|nr:hypothetical protein [Priestia megaterium]
MEKGFKKYIQLHPEYKDRYEAYFKMLPTKQIGYIPLNVKVSVKDI